MSHHAAARRAKNGSPKHRHINGHREDLPDVIAPSVAAPLVKTGHGFDFGDLHLPKWIEDRALGSGGFPHEEHYVLSTIDYAGKDEHVVRQPDALILGGTELIAK